MRRLTIVSIAILIIAGSALAQQPVKGISSKGIKLGLGSSMISTEYEALKALFEFKIGFHGGAFLTYDLTPELSIQPELLLSIKGTTTGGIFQLLNWSSNYVEVPVLLKYNLTSESSNKPTIYAGPSISYLMSSELKIIFIDPIDVTEFMNRIDFGFAVGSSFDVKRFTFEARYTFGFGTVIDAADKVNAMTGADLFDPYYFPEDPTVKNRFLSFMAGYKF